MMSVFFLKQEKRLKMNMELKKLQQKVKEQQEKVGEKVALFAHKLCYF